MPFEIRDAAARTIGAIVFGAVCVVTAACGGSTGTSSTSSAQGPAVAGTQGDAAMRVCSQAQVDSGLSGTGGSGASGAQGQGPGAGGASTGATASSSATSGGSGQNVPAGGGTDQSALVTACAATIRAAAGANPDAGGSMPAAITLACRIMRGDVPPQPGGAATPFTGPSASTDPGVATCASKVGAALGVTVPASP